jgi:ethanolamine permease
MWRCLHNLCRNPLTYVYESGKHEAGHKDGSVPLSTSNLIAFMALICMGHSNLFWNEGLKSGMLGLISSYFLVFIAYMLQLMCSYEITGALPYANNPYSIARCVSGFYLGYLLIVLQLVQYTIFTSLFVEATSMVISSAFNIHPNYKYLLSFILVVINSSILTTFSNPASWRIFTIVSILAALMLAIYIIGSFKHWNLPQFGPVDGVGWITTDASEYSSSFPIATLPYIGLEILSYITKPAMNGEAILPLYRYYFIGYFLVCFMILVVCILGCAIAPGTDALSQSMIPLSPGYAEILDMSGKLACLLSFPSLIGCALAFSRGYQEVLLVLKASHLLPKAWMKFESSTLFIMISASSFCLTLLFISQSSVRNCILHAGILAAILSSMLILQAYFIFNRYYTNITRSYTSPCGIYGMIVAFSIFLYDAVCVLSFQGDDGAAVTTVAVIIIFASMYYFLYAKSRQKVSDSELKLRFGSLVADFNRRVNHRIRHGGKSSKSVYSKKSNSSYAKRSAKSKSNSMDSYCMTATAPTITCGNINNAKIVPEIITTHPSSECVSDRVIHTYNNNGISDHVTGMDIESFVNGDGNKPGRLKSTSSFRIVKQPSMIKRQTSVVQVYSTTQPALNETASFEAFVSTSSKKRGLQAVAVPVLLEGSSGDVVSQV